MVLSRLIVTLSVALLATAIFVGLLRWRRPGSGRSGPQEALSAAFAFFFVMTFAVTWALGGWLVPFGPVWRGVPWLVSMALGLLVALVVYVSAGPGRHAPAGGAGAATMPRIHFSFWLLLVILALLGLASFVLGPTPPAL